MSTLKRKILGAFWLWLAFTFAASVSEAKILSLASHKDRLSVQLNSPAGWNGPVYTLWPSYETWSFGKGKESAASYIEIRIDPVRGPKLNSNTASTAEIKKTFNDFTNPIIEKVADAKIGATPVVVWAAHNVDGELLFVDLRRGGRDYNFLLRTNSPCKLRHYQKTFIDLVKSVQFFKS